MKKIFMCIIWTACALSISVVASAGEYSGKVVIDVHNYLNNKAFVKAIDDAKKMKKYEDVEFVVAERDELYETAMPIKISSGQQVDIIAAYNPIYQARWAEAGLLIPLDEYADDLGADYDELFGPYAGFGYYKDQKVSLPTNLTKWVLFYNKSIFDKAGVPYPDPDVPMTWKEYREIAKKLTSGSGADKVYGSHHLDWPMYWYGEAIMKLGGGQHFYNEEGMSNIEDPAFREALKATYDMMHEDKSVMSYAEIRSSRAIPQTFFNGHYGMLLQGPWFLNWALDKEHYPRDWEIGIAPLPVDSGTKFKTWGVSGSLGIAASTGDPELAFSVALDIIKGTAKYTTTEPLAIRLPQPDLFKEPGEKLASEGMSTEVLQKYFLAEDEIFVTEKITGPASAQYDTICMEEVEKYFVDEQSLDETINNIKRRINLYIKNFAE